MKTIEIKKNFHAPLSTIWEEWTNNHKLETWLTEKANVYPKLGGHFELFWDPENPNKNSTINCKIKEIIPKKKLAFNWKGPVPYADLMNIDPLPTSVSILFEKINDNETMTTLIHSGFGESIAWKEAQEWQTKAWEIALAQLQLKHKNTDF
jgi:uncharacterized protein YndB with AHSA1/START domain